MRIVWIITLAALLFNSCRSGCKDKKACNYNGEKILKGTCNYDPEKFGSAELVKSYPQSNEYRGLDLTTGAIITSSTAVNGLLYYLQDTKVTWGMLYIPGSIGLWDFGNVGGLCEINVNTNTTSAQNASHKNGYSVHFNSANTNARFIVDELDIFKMKIKYEYPF